MTRVAALTSVFVALLLGVIAQDESSEIHSSFVLLLCYPCFR